MFQIRPARMDAMYVHPGDQIISAPGDQPEMEIIGTVVTAQTVDAVRHFTVRAPSGSTWQMRKGDVRPVWIHVPTPTADRSA